MGMLSAQGGCTHQARWKACHAALRDEENLASTEHEFVLLVNLPVDFTWSNLACEVNAFLHHLPGY